jgi:hypothetical protein
VRRNVVFDLDHLRYRSACASDAAAIAALHADSWRRHYRGTYSAGFLDGDVKLAATFHTPPLPGYGHCTIAEVGAVGGSLLGASGTEDDLARA